MKIPRNTHSVAALLVLVAWTSSCSDAPGNGATGAATVQSGGNGTPQYVHDPSWPRTATAESVDHGRGRRDVGRQ